MNPTPELLLLPYLKAVSQVANLCDHDKSRVSLAWSVCKDKTCDL